MTSTAEEPRIAVVTDSVAQVPSAKARELGIQVIPFPIRVAGREYRDGVDLSAAEIYRQMREAQVLPTTSHPSVGEYAQIFRGCLQRNAPAVLYLTLSGALSGAGNAANDAVQMLESEFPDRPIVVWVTKMAAIGQGFIAMEAARAAAQGISLEQVIRRAERVRQRVGFAASLETLEYLARGGRIGRAASLLGGLLQIKPIVTIEPDGVVAPIARPRGNHAALEFIVNFVRDHTTGSNGLHLAVMQADNEAEATQLQDLATQVLHPTDIFMTDFTPVMGAHAGPGVVGLAYYVPVLERPGIERDSA